MIIGHHSADPDWQEANLQTTSLFAWQEWEIRVGIVLRSARYTLGSQMMGSNDPNSRWWGTMLNQMICLSFPSVLVRYVWTIIQKRRIFKHFYRFCFCLLFWMAACLKSVVPALFFHCNADCGGGYRARRKGFLSRGRRQHLPTPSPSLIFDPALKLKLLSPALLHQCFLHFEVKINVNEKYLNILKGGLALCPWVSHNFGSEMQSKREIRWYLTASV